VTFNRGNFYGRLAVRESPCPLLAEAPVRTLSSRTRPAWAAGASPTTRTEPTFYYGRESGVGIALQRPPSAHRVGAIGLGVGTVAATGGLGIIPLLRAKPPA